MEPHRLKSLVRHSAVSNGTCWLWL